MSRGARATLVPLCKPLAILWLVAGGTPAAAYNHETHQALTDLAYEVMRVVEQGGVLGGLDITASPPSGVSVSAWNAFLAEMAQGTQDLRGLDAGLPPPKSENCVAEGLGNVLPSNWAAGKTIGQLGAAPKIDYIKGPDGIDCGVIVNWTPGGVFDATNPGSDVTGMVLGFYGAAVDDEVDDTHLWIRPTSSVGLGAFKSFVNDAISFGLGIVLAPLVCLFDCIFDDCSCPSPDDVGNDVNVLDDLEGLVPGIGDFTSEDYVGFWHHINMGFWATNQYDDRQGMLLEDGGWLGVPDPVDLLLWVGFDLSGMSLRYDESRGPKRYSVLSASDFHELTEKRSEGEWQFTTITHTAMEPLDNLAYWGWQKFHNVLVHETKHLGWPLHALGDAIAPHHVIGTPAWGHRPFEDAQENLWKKLRFEEGVVGGVQTREQREQASRILERAWHWRQFIVAWRLLHPGNDRVVPVRALVTALAQETYDYCVATEISDGWPYHELASMFYLQQLTGPALGIYEDWTNALGLARPLFENSAGAQIAFLMSAMEAIR